MHTILVLGGTGLLGRPVVDRLDADGFHIRVLTRDPDRARALLPPSVELVEGDAPVIDDVRAAAAGCDGVHVSVSGRAELPAVHNVAIVAPDSGVKRILYLSGSTVSRQNAGFPMIDQKLVAEHRLRDAPVPTTILRPTWPMEQLPRFVRDGRATIIGDQPTPLHWFAAEDLARMVSAAIRTEAAADTRLYVHGPEAVPMKAALERYCEAEHPGVEVATLPIAAARAATEASGDAVLAFMTDLMAYFDRAGELGDSADADRILGPNTITLDRWLARRSRTVTA